MLGAALLHIADDGVKQHHGEHDGSVDQMTDQDSEHGRGEQHIDQQIVELGEEAEDLAALAGRSEAIGTETLFSRFGLLRCEAIRPRLERC